MPYLVCHLQTMVNRRLGALPKWRSRPHLGAGGIFEVYHVVRPVDNSARMQRIEKGVRIMVWVARNNVTSKTPTG